MSRRLRLSRKKGAERKITLLHKAQASVQWEPTSEEPPCIVAISEKVQREGVLGNDQP